MSVYSSFIRLLCCTGLVAAFCGCGNNPDDGTPPESVNFEKRQIDLGSDSLFTGNTYLPIYSEIYSISEHRKRDLTVTVSMRNTDYEDSLFVLSAAYYNTTGELIRDFVTKPIFIKPMETVEIVIQEDDSTGGTGANFMFQWASRSAKANPLFEAVMISTANQQGLSFTTRGKNLNHN